LKIQFALFTDSCFERFWTWPRPKAMGRVRYRCSLRDALPTNFDNDFGSCLCSPLRQSRIEVRSLLRRSGYVYILEPQSQASNFAAENVRVTGDLANDAIQIKSIALMKQQTSQSQQ
jgi:hypothetical protein